MLQEEKKKGVCSLWYEFQPHKKKEISKSKFFKWSNSVKVKNENLHFPNVSSYTESKHSFAAIFYSYLSSIYYVYILNITVRYKHKRKVAFM